MFYVNTELIHSGIPEYHCFLLKDLIASFTYKEMFVCFFNISLTSSSIVTRILATPFNFGRRGMLLLSRILYIVCSDFIPVRFIISFISNSCLYRATTCSSCSIVSIRPLAMITLIPSDKPSHWLHCQSYYHNANIRYCDITAKHITIIIS